MIYNASLDLFTKASTFLVTCLFVIISAFQFYVPQNTVTVVLPILLLAVYVLVFLYRPLGYQIEDGNIIVIRVLSKLNVAIPLRSVTHADYVERKMLGFVWRTFGVGGLFGYFGSFASSKLGAITFYATRRDKLVLIKTPNKLYAITPDEPEQFVADLNQFLQ